MFRAGQQIGVYTLLEKLGRGGFGEVWLAEKRTQFVTKRVAIKLPHEEQVNFAAISHEAQLWEQASGHPNVLPIIDADVYDNQVVIVSEYADGGSLADKLKRETKLSLNQAVEMTIGILAGLEFLHSRNIIHRDIKPQNILLQGNTPRLADFGISRAMNTTIVSSAIIGTDAYMSPESFDGKRNAQTDIWSVGVVLYQLLKGSLPFPQEHPSERMFAVLTKSFEPLPDDVPADLRRIVQKALAKQPEQRYKTASEMREDLRKALTYLENPTFAPTEILRKPDWSFPESNAQTALDNQQIPKPNDNKIRVEIPKPEDKTFADAPEVKTVVNKTHEPVYNPVNEIPPTQMSYPQDFAERHFNQQQKPVSSHQSKENYAQQDFKIYGKPLNENQTGIYQTLIRNKSLEVGIALSIGLILVVGAIIIGVRTKNSGDSPDIKITTPLDSSNTTNKAVLINSNSIYSNYAVNKPSTNTSSYYSGTNTSSYNAPNSSYSSNYGSNYGANRPWNLYNGNTNVNR